MHKPATIQADLENLPGVFWPYRDLKIWTTWDWVLVNGRWTKPPFQPDGRNAKSQGPETWCTYVEALAAVKAGKAAGIGIMLFGMKSLEIIFDIDHCRDPITAVIAPWAQEIIDAAASYTEVTPSGAGVRILGLGDIGRVHKRFNKVDGADGGLEVYTAGEARYITVTGLQVPKCWPMMADISELASRLVANKGRMEAEQPSFEPQPPKTFEPAPAYNPKPGSIGSMLGLRTPEGDLRQLIREGAPNGQRSEQFHHAVGLARRLNWTPEALEREMRTNPSGIASKYLAPQDRLVAEIARCWGKVEAPVMSAQGWEKEFSGSTGGTSEEKGEAHQQEQGGISANVFTIPDESKIPPRDWLYGRHLIRGFVSATIAPGGVGKSSLIMAESMAMVTGKPLLGVNISRPLRVWAWCLEDPRDELNRRAAAIAKHYSITNSDIQGRFFLNSGRDTPLCIAEQERKSGTIIIRPDVPALVAEIKKHKIDVVSVDPFVASHLVSENDNVAINAVMRQWVMLAEICQVAVELVHHTRKNGDSEVTAETSRGAKAMIDATRDTRVLNQMSEEEGRSFGVENRRLYFRVYSDKMNLAPPAEKSDWYHLTDVALANGAMGSIGDHVGVPVAWSVPGPWASVSWETINAILSGIDRGVLRDSGEPTGDPWSPSKAGKSNSRWVGNLVTDMTGMDENEAKRALKAWLDSGVLIIIDCTVNRKATKGIAVDKAKWAEMRPING